MLKEKIPVAREGYPFIGYSAFITLLCGMAEFWVATALMFLVTTFILMFFRDPERIVPENTSGVVSPADGKIIIAETVNDDRYSDAETLKISIFMNVFNVHVNRIPFPGTIESVRYIPGTFVAADKEKAHLKNERCVVTMQTQQGQTITFVQIAGLIARRIVCRLQAKDDVQRGQRFGLIRFGSRVDVHLPATSRLSVAIGDKVVAGETILAHLEAP